MKIKIIDLLVKIANGEESTKVKTKYDSVDWEENDFLFSIYNEFEHKNNYEIVKFLNDYVEIIEEPKKIEKEGLFNLDESMSKASLVAWQKANNGILKKKIDELIDEINNLKEK